MSIIIFRYKLGGIIGIVTWLPRGGSSKAKNTSLEHYFSLSHFNIFKIYRFEASLAFTVSG